MTDLMIETMSIEVPTNRRKDDLFEMKASVKIDDSIIAEVLRQATIKSKAKYPDALVAPIFRVHFSRRGNENFFTASCEMCIGDGDYISRVAKVELPTIHFAIRNEYNDIKEEK